MAKGFDREDGSCPECGGHAVKRQGPRGVFMGCSGFPECRNTEPVGGRRWSGDLLMGGDERMEAWAEACLSDKDWF